VTESAIETPAELRRARTRREITAYARRLTAKSGLQGFTVEDLCEHVGISRRTFFNYFPGKDQAVLGHDSDEFDPAAVEAFLAGRPDGVTGISPTLLDDLVDFTIANFETVGLTPEGAQGFIAAVQKEPRLMEQLMRRGAENDRFLTLMVGAREGFTAEHPVPQAAATIVGALVRTGMQHFIADGNTATLPELLHEQLQAAKTLFAAASGSTPHIATDVDAAPIPRQGTS
jgi:AcrR family transcriptional regulator